MLIYSIYKATNKVNGKVYIGFDSNWPKRRISHKCASKTKNTKFYYAIRKHGWDSFVWEVIYQSQDHDHTLTVMEPLFIYEHNSMSDGYNTTVGGEGVSGLRRVMPEEEKIRRSMIAKGKPKSDQHREAMRNKAISDSHRRALSDAAIRRGGRPRSEETRSKMSQSQKNVTLQSHICPHCGVSGKGNALKRWHFDSCKHKI